MSQESFSSFRAKLAEDQALRDEMSRALGANGTAEDMAAFGKERGYDFTADEVKQTLELSDDELDAVSGGTTLLQACATGQHIKKAEIHL